jgi:murein DD-endopeptidase MepM/ murein hydrolase activator NlpD
MNFDRTPEKALLKVTDSTGTLFYSGDYFTFLTDDYLYQQIKSDTTLHFALSASWSSTSVDQGSGTADYLFSVTVLFDPTADFWLGESQIESGEFVVLSGNYIDDLEDIQITIEPSISYTPVFYRDGENIRALLPFPLSLGNEDREYTITVNYLGIVTELSLHVSTSSTAELHKRRYSYDVKVNTSVRTEENLLEFQNFLAQLPSQDEILFTGSFRFPTESIRAEFGDWIDNEGSDATTFLSGGMAFVCYPATAIYAVNSGKVVAITETTYGGTTVVVDHGLGLKSVYYCLAKVAVSTGDLVTSDTVIGYGSQKVGYTDGITAYIELWVGDQPVSYYPLLSDGRTGKIEWGEPS